MTTWPHAEREAQRRALLDSAEALAATHRPNAAWLRKLRPYVYAALALMTGAAVVAAVLEAMGAR